MSASRLSWVAAGVAVFVVMCLANPSLADEEQEKGKGKGKVKDSGKPQVVQIDLSKLPPDLAKQVLRYVEGGDRGKHKKEAKNPGPKAQSRTVADLPPGLARKSKDHPAPALAVGGDGRGRTRCESERSACGRPRGIIHAASDREQHRMLCLASGRIAIAPHSHLQEPASPATPAAPRRAVPFSSRQQFGRSGVCSCRATSRRRPPRDADSR